MTHTDAGWRLGRVEKVDGDTNVMTIEVDGIRRDILGTSSWVEGERIWVRFYNDSITVERPCQICDKCTGQGRVEGEPCA